MEEKEIILVLEELKERLRGTKGYLRYSSDVFGMWVTVNIFYNDEKIHEELVSIEGLQRYTKEELQRIEDVVNLIEMEPNTKEEESLRRLLLTTQKRLSAMSGKISDTRTRSIEAKQEYDEIIEDIKTQGRKTGGTAYTSLIISIITIIIAVLKLK